MQNTLFLFFFFMFLLTLRETNTPSWLRTRVHDNVVYSFCPPVTMCFSTLVGRRGRQRRACLVHECKYAVVSFRRTKIINVRVSCKLIIRGGGNTKKKNKTQITPENRNAYPGLRCYVVRAHFGCRWTASIRGEGVGGGGGGGCFIFSCHNERMRFQVCELRIQMRTDFGFLNSWIAHARKMFYVSKRFRPDWRTFTAAMAVKVDTKDRVNVWLFCMNLDAYYSYLVQRHCIRTRIRTHLVVPIVHRG